MLGPNTTVSGINASLLEKGKITGKLTGADGITPLQYVYVKAQVPDGYGNWNFAAEARTSVDGSYVLENLDARTYKIGFLNDPYRRYETPVIVEEYYNNAPSITSAVDIVVTTSATVSGIDASLTEKGKITGRVTGPDGIVPLQQISVSVEAQNTHGYWDILSYTITRADGTYTLRGLEVTSYYNKNSYRVSFSDPTNRVYATEYYNNAYGAESAVGVSVEANATVSNIDASLSERGRITGKVTGDSGLTPINGIEVVAYFYSPDFATWYSDTSNKVLTQPDGSYDLRGLEAGTYRIKFSDPDHRVGADRTSDMNKTKYSDEFHGNVTNVGSATSILIGVGHTVSGIDASLAESGKITGTVTSFIGARPLDKIHVTAYPKNSTPHGNSVVTAYTDKDGNYSVRGLGEGNYSIHFYDYSNSLYEEEFYDNAANLESAKDILVKENTTVNGIDASLLDKGKIAGTVTGPDGSTPLQWITVEAYRKDYEGWIYEGDTTTLTDESYSFQGLETGEYRIRFSDYEEYYDTEYYNDVPDFESAVNIAVATNTIAGNINAVMNRLRPKIEIIVNSKSIKQLSKISFKSPQNGKGIITKVFTIKNSGSAVLNWFKITKKGASSSDFTVSNLKVTSLVLGESTTFKVTFKPSSAESSTTSLLIPSNDFTKIPFVIRLVGNGKKGKAKSAIVSSHLANSVTQPNSRSLPGKIIVGSDYAGDLKYQTLTVMKSPLSHAVPGMVEVSSDLTEWFSGNDHTTILFDNPNYFQVRDNTPISKEQKRFIRLTETK